MLPRVRVPPEEEDEAPPPPQPATTSNATTSADINASNLLLTLINLPSSANNSRGSISGRTAIRGRSEKVRSGRERIRRSRGLWLGIRDYLAFFAASIAGCTTSRFSSSHDWTPLTSPSLV